MKGFCSCGHPVPNWRGDYWLCANCGGQLLQPFPSGLGVDALTAQLEGSLEALAIEREKVQRLRTAIQAAVARYEQAVAPPDWVTVLWASLEATA